MASKTITSSVQEYLDTDIVGPNIGPSAIVTSTRSPFEYAAAEGLTLQQYVQQYGDRAIKEAEGSLAEWMNIQTQAAIEGEIRTDNGFYTVNKNTVKLIEKRVEAAQKQVELVYNYYLSSAMAGEQRRDQLVRVLYNKAIQRGDLHAITYLIDRVDGRPGEARVVDLNFDHTYNVYAIIHTLFSKQLDVINSGNGTKLICCSRRAGKTHLLSALLLMESLRRNDTHCIYIGETMEQSLSLVKDAMNKIIDECHLRDRSGKRLDWQHLDNGSRILVRGMSNTRDPDLLRGNKAKVVVIDEFFHLATRHNELLEYLVREVLQPMQMDYADDYKFICSGTPPSIKGTYGEQAWKTWDVPHYVWTWEDNPHPVDKVARKAYIESILAEKGLDWTSSFARREYGAEWIYDEDLLLYPDVCVYNPEVGLPNMEVDQVLFGMDYGVGDCDSLIGIAWNNTERRGFVFHEDKFNRLDVKDRTISQLEYLEQRIRIAWQEALDFFPSLEPAEANKRILWDADDNNQHVTDHLNLNCRIPNKDTLKLNIENAHKTDKVLMFDKIKDLLRTGSLLLIENGRTFMETQQTVLKRGMNGQVYPEIDDRVFHPDLLPAMRYALWNVIGQEVYKRPGERGHGEY